MTRGDRKMQKRRRMEARRNYRRARRLVLESAAGRCHYCGDVFDELTIDHVIPLSRGGSNSPTNLVAACLGCNQTKADRLFAEHPSPMKSAVSRRGER